MSEDRTPSPELDTLIARACVLRAAGKSVAEIAAAVDRSEDTVTGWRSKYRSAWEQHYAEAHRRVVQSAEAEAWHALRRGLRSDNEDLQVRAAHSIVSNAIKGRPQDINLTMIDGLADGLVQVIQQFVPEEHREAAAEAIRERLG